MILAAHQPCYLPNLTFFYKMCQADVFILADDLKYTTHNLINRTKIKTARGVHWLSVPVRTKGRLKQLIHAVQIDTAQNWQHKHWKSLLVNYKYAAYFDKYADFFENLYTKSWCNLLQLNLEIIVYILKCLNISTKILFSSELNLQGKGSQRLINLLEKLECDTYITEAAYRSYLSPELFRDYGFKLNFFSYHYSIYHQQFGDFVAGLSIADLLFNEGELSYHIILGK
ncbi:MAG: WbqC family protein [bacterium]